MEARTERLDGVVVVYVSGRLDGSNIGEFEEIIQAAATDEDRAMVMDLEKLTYVSSVGLRAMLMTAKKRFRGEASFALCSLQGVMRGKFELVGFDKIITIYPTKAEAIAALSPGAAE